MGLAPIRPQVHVEPFLLTFSPGVVDRWLNCYLRLLATDDFLTESIRGIYLQRSRSAFFLQHRD